MTKHITHQVMTAILSNPVLILKTSGSSLEIHLKDPIPENLAQTKSLHFKELLEIINRIPKVYDD